MTRRICLLSLLAWMAPAQRVEGDLKLWHRVTVSFEGPETAEDASPNPFTDYRLMVEFRHAASGRTVRVPGFYAADGNAAETSASNARRTAGRQGAPLARAAAVGSLARLGGAHPQKAVA